MWPGGAESPEDEARPQELVLGCHKTSEEGQKRKGEPGVNKDRVKEGISEPCGPEVGNRA